MSFTVELRDTAISYLDKLEEHNAKIRKLEGERNVYSASYFQDLMNAAKAKREVVVNEGKDAIKQITDAFKKDVTARYTPDGTKLTEDAAVLNSGIKLTQQDVENMFDKYDGNVTMQRLIVDYANDSNIHLERAFCSEAEKHDGADTLAKYAVSALTGDWRAAFVLNDKYWAQIMPDAVKGE